MRGVERSYHRGHMIELGPDGDLPWVYSDTGQPVPDNPNRACGLCGQPPTPEGHDGCLGTLPGVRNACCGHGSSREAYVQMDSGEILAGLEAFAFFTKHVDFGSRTIPREAPAGSVRLVAITTEEADLLRYARTLRDNGERFRKEIADLARRYDFREDDAAFDPLVVRAPEIWVRLNSTSSRG